MYGRAVENLFPFSRGKKKNSRLGKYLTELRVDSDSNPSLPNTCSTGVKMQDFLESCNRNFAKLGNSIKYKCMVKGLESWLGG